MSVIGFLTAAAWLDMDGYHVWQAHDCVGGRSRSMLPWPTWIKTQNGSVWPSVTCHACGLHVFLALGSPEVA